MTKYNDTIIKFIDEWFELRQTLNEYDYKMLRKYAYEVLK